MLCFNTFQGKPANFRFKWHFTLNHNSSADFSTLVGLDLHLFHLSFILVMDRSPRFKSINSDNCPKKICFHYWHTPKLLDGLNYKSKAEDNERRRSWGMLFSSQHLGGGEAYCSSEMDEDKRQVVQLLTRTCTNQTTSWLVHSWSTFGAQTSHDKHGLTRFITVRTWGKPPPSPL